MYTLVIISAGKENKVKEFVSQAISSIFNITIYEIKDIIGHNSFLEEIHISKKVNHPVHIVDILGELSPSAFIPFCKFGDWIGVIIDQFEDRVCDIFKAKVLNDQLCYEVDPNRFKNKVSSQYLKRGLTFYVDTNNEKEITTKDDNEFMIYLDTIGTFYYVTQTQLLFNL